MAVARAKPVKVCARCRKANWKSSMIKSKTTGNYYCKSLKECDGTTNDNQHGSELGQVGR